MDNRKRISEEGDSINQIKEQKLLRLHTGKYEIDWLAGFTKWPSNLCWGLPCGKVSCWSGRSGVGKSRVTTEIAKSASLQKDNKGINYPVYYFCLEEEKNTFVSSAKKDGVILPSTFYVSNERSLAKQIEKIREKHAHIVFIDSINQVEEYSGYSDDRIREVIETYRNIAVEMDGHIILISQLNKEGLIKGSEALPHLVDIKFEIESSKKVLDKYGEGHFEVRLGDKNRGARVGKDFYSVWKHYENKADVVSKNRMEDKFWPASHGLKRVIVYKPNTFLASLGFTKKPTYSQVWHRIQNNPKLMNQYGLMEDLRVMVGNGEVIWEDDVPARKPGFLETIRNIF